jgi:hypothetical protein
VVFAAAFATDLPAACPVPAVIMQILKTGAPCRKTRMGCNDFAAHGVKHTGRSQAIVNSVFQRQPSDVQLPGFRWCQGPASLPPLGPGVQAAQANSYLALADMPYPHQSVQSPGQQHEPQTPPAAGSSRDLTPPITPALVAVAATHPAEATEKCIEKVSDLVAKFQQRATASKAAATQARDEATDDAGASGATGPPAMKRPAAASKTTPAAKKSKLEAAAKKTEPATLKPKPKEKSKTKPVAEKEFSQLVYITGSHLPRYYGSATVYTDSKANVWRVKPCPGSRADKKFNMKSDGAENRGQWKTLVAYVKPLKQV